MTNILGMQHLIEPIIQSGLTSWIGFRSNQDIMTLIYLIYFLLFGAVSIWKRKKEQKREEQELSEQSEE